MVKAGHQTPNSTPESTDPNQKSWIEQYRNRQLEKIRIDFAERVAMLNDAHRASVTRPKMSNPAQGGEKPSPESTSFKLSPKIAQLLSCRLDMSRMTPAQRRKFMLVQVSLGRVLWYTPSQQIETLAPSYGQLMPCFKPVFAGCEPSSRHGSTTVFHSEGALPIPYVLPVLTGTNQFPPPSNPWAASESKVSLFVLPQDLDLSPFPFIVSHGQTADWRAPQMSIFLDTWDRYWDRLCGKMDQKAIAAVQKAQDWHTRGPGKPRKLDVGAHSGSGPTNNWDNWDHDELKTDVNEMLEPMDELKPKIEPRHRY